MAIWCVSKARRSLGRLHTVLLQAALIAVAFGGTLLPMSEARASTEPIMWGAYIDGVPWEASKLEAFESRAGKRVSIIQFGNPWYHSGAFQKFPAKDLQTIRDHGAIPMLA